MQSLSLRSALRRDSGFSLVELIVVVAILGILAIVAIPVYGAIQATATQNAVNVAANNAYTGATEAYARGGATAAEAYIRKLNADSDTIQIKARDLPTVPFEGDDAWRAQYERWRYMDDNLDPASGFGFMLSRDNVMNDFDEYLTQPGYSVGSFCITALDISNGFPVKTLGFAGNACGAPGDPSKWE